MDRSVLILNSNRTNIITFRISYVVRSWSYFPRTISEFCITVLYIIMFDVAILMRRWQHSLKRWGARTFQGTNYTFCRLSRLTTLDIHDGIWNAQFSMDWTKWSTSTSVDDARTSADENHDKISVKEKHTYTTSQLRVVRSSHRVWNRECGWTTPTTTLNKLKKKTITHSLTSPIIFFASSSRQCHCCISLGITWYETVQLFLKFLRRWQNDEA